MKYKGFKIIEFEIKENNNNYYALTNGSKVIVGEDIKEIKVKIDKHKKNIKKAIPSKLFPNLIKEINKIHKKEVLK